MPQRRTAEKVILALYAFTSLYLIPVYPHFNSANEFSRWVTVAGLVEHGTLDSRWAQPIIGILIDASRSGERLYSNKAPGLALLAAPGYLLLRPVLGPPTIHNLRWSLDAMRIFGTTIPALALALLLARRERADPFCLAVFLFATPAYIYGMLLFSHVTVAALLYLAYRLLYGGGAFPRDPWRTILAGAACGLATLTEYPAVLATAALGLLLLASPRCWRRVTLFVAGGAPFAILLGFYNRWLFGSWFSISSAHEASANTAELASEGLFGIRWPTGSTLWTILGSPSRGLLFFSPILAFGVVALWPRKSVRASPGSWARLLVVALIFLAIAGYPANDGGWCVGARYLVAILPFLVDAMHERHVLPGFASGLLLVFSAVLCVLPMMTLPFAAPDYQFLHATFTRPLLSEGFFTPNWASRALPGGLSLLPAVLAAAAAVAAALRGGGRRTGAGAAAGAALAAAVVMMPIRETDFLRLHRSVVLETYFRPEGRITRHIFASRDPEERRRFAKVEMSIRQARELAPDDWPYLDRARSGRTMPREGTGR